MRRFILSAATIATTLFVASCSQDDDAGDIQTLDVPENYTFTRGGESTVNFSGQTTRILMSEEIAAAFLDFDNATEASIDSKFAHQEGENNFENASLNASNKNVRSKTAASTDFFSSNTAVSAEIKADFDNLIEDQINEVFPNRNTQASPGVAGQIADGTSTRYVTANGVEPNQFFAKGLIGALMTDQILNNYLGEAVLDEADNRANNDAEITAEGKVYTTMEHKWDEAYGYLYGTAADASNPNTTLGEADNFLNKYAGRVANDPDFAGIADEIFEAFKIGRAAIVAGEYEIRDAQAAILRQKISEIIAIRSVYYIQQGKTGIENEDFGAAFHDLSEGLGFVYSLQFTRQPGTNAPFFTRDEVTTFINNMLGDGDNGLWTVSPQTLEGISVMIASKFDFTVEEAASSN